MNSQWFLLVRQTQTLLNNTVIYCLYSQPKEMLIIERLVNGKIILLSSKFKDSFEFSAARGTASLAEAAAEAEGWW